MKCGIYKATNRRKGDYYIGASYNIEKAWADHCLNKDPKCWVDRLIKQQTSKAIFFEILEECEPYQLLDLRLKYKVKSIS